MTAPPASAVATAPLTYEDIVGELVALLAREGALAEARPVPWDSFLGLSDLVHESFEIPSTTITPIARRLLFALGFAARPRRLVGVGTFVGYALAWLVRDRRDARTAPFVEAALGLEIDPRANAIARQNCALLGHGDRLRFATADGTRSTAYPAAPIDLLYLDLDDEGERKAGYVRALEACRGLLRRGGLVLAHDPCVPLFADDFAAYHAFVRDSPRLRGPWVLPVDECGLSVACVA